MKVIKTDNFCRDHISDKLIAENVSSYYANLIVKLLLEDDKSPDTSNYYKAVEDEYKLYVFEP